MIDINKLTISSQKASIIIAQCPACASLGADLRGKNHLAVFKDGKFGCCVDNTPEHYCLIEKLVGTDSDSTGFYIAKASEPIPEVERLYPEAILGGLVKDYGFYQAKGISDTLLGELRSGIALKGNMNGRYVFPIYNMAGRIHGFTGRTLYNSQIKWKHIGVKSNWVYPAFFNKKDIKEANSVILVESVGDALALMSAGVRNVIVLFGVNLHSKVLSFLIALNLNKIYISTNNDIKHQVGQIAANKIQTKLSRYFGEDKIAIKLPSKKDFGEMSEEEIKEWLKDANS